MKLYFANSLIRLLHGSSDDLSDIPDNYVDMVLTDPPYGIDYVTGHRKRPPGSKNVIATLERFTEIAGDKAFDEKMLRDVLYECHRVMKDKSALYWFTRWDAYAESEKLLSELFNVRNVITWVKNNWTAGDKDGNYAYQTEQIIYATKGDHKLIGKRPTNALFFKRVSGDELKHPAQKPVELLKYLISKSCPHGGVVLDTFLGSGSTAVAAQEMSRKCIGVDVEDKNLDIAQARLEKKSLPLFDDIEIVPKNFEMKLTEVAVDA